jgi:hypothetical protein
MHDIFDLVTGPHCYLPACPSAPHSIFWQTEGLGEWAVIRQNGTTVAELTSHSPAHAGIGATGEHSIEISSAGNTVLNKAGYLQW